MRTLRLFVVGVACTGLMTSAMTVSAAEVVDESEAPGHAFVSGSMQAEAWREGPRSFEGDLVVWEVATEADISMDDPRLRGVMQGVWTIHEFRGSNEWVSAAIVEIANDGGSWTGTGRWFFPAGGLEERYIELSGQGGYEGSTAMLFVRENPEAEPDYLVSGARFDGPMPEAPDKLPSE